MAEAKRKPLELDAIKRALESNVPQVCDRLLPNGKRKGIWWRDSVPWRVDKHPSLFINLNSGVWKDTGRDETGDLFELIERTDKCDFYEATLKLGRLLGVIT